ncbi:MAG: prepilin peptidase [Pseudomonadota bacterium]
MALEMTAAPAVVIFFSGMLHASITDLKHRRIANWTILGLLMLWLPVAMIAGLPAEAMIGSVAAAVLIFIIGFACFCFGWVGGGDVKLAAVAVLWLGAALAPAYLMLSAIFGALIALIFLGLAYVKRRWGASIRADAKMLPYGPGLASAAIVLFGKSQWYTHLP